MADFTVQITDPSVIFALPNLNLMQPLYDDSSTEDDIIAFLENAVSRNKFQSYLEYELTDDVLTRVNEVYMNAFLSQFSDEDTIEQIDSTTVRVNDKIYFLKINKFGDTLFINDHFNSVFFTQNVIDKIMTLGDNGLIRALFNVPYFWNNLTANSDLYTYFKNTYGVQLLEATQTSEVAFVKVTTADSDATSVEKVDSIVDLLQLPEVVTEILSNENLKTILNTSPYGGKLGVLFLANSYSLEDVVNNDAVIERLANDPDSVEIVAQIQFLNQIPSDSSLYKAIVNNDVYLGKAIKKYFNLDKDITYTQVFYDESLSDVAKGVVTTPEVIKVVLQSNITQVVWDSFISKYYKYNICNNYPYVVKTDNWEMFLLNNGTIKKGTLAFPDDSSEYFEVALTDVPSANGEYVASMVFADSTKAVIYTNLSKDVKVINDVENYTALLYSVVNKQVDLANMKDKHISAIEYKTGRIVDNMFVSDNAVDVNNFVDMQVNKASTIINATDKIIVSGIFETPAATLQSVISDNLSDISYGFGYGQKMYVLNKDKNAVKEVTADGLVDSNILDAYVDDTDNALQNTIKAVRYLDNVLFVLDGNGNLWYKNSDGSIQKVPEISNIDKKGDAIIAETEAGNFLLVNDSGKVRKYIYSNLFA